MQVNKERIQSDLAALRKFSQPCEAGITRPSFTPEYRQAVDYLIVKMQEIGMVIWEDGFGHLYGRLEGSDPQLPLILSGSHVDTVPCGGPLDGIAGVVCALEAARLVVESGKPLRHPLEVVGFMEEEGSVFNIGALGSMFITGAYGDQELDTLTDKKGEVLRDAIRRYGASGKMDDICRVEEPVKAFLELHIEQGPVLENQGKQIGVVEAITGSNAHVITIHGTAGHAGTTPMNSRQDAGLASSRMIVAMDAYVREHCPGDTVFTVGKIEFRPGSYNIIPSWASFTIDLRSLNQQNMEKAAAHIQVVAKALEEELGVAIDVAPLAKSLPVPMDSHLADLIEQEAEQLGCPHMRMGSGAGHDAMNLAKIWPTGMIFVPSIRGLSHHPEENTLPEDLAQGAQVLYQVIRRLDQE